MGFFKDILKLIGGLFTPPARPRPARPIPQERAELVGRLDQCPFGVNSHVAVPKVIATLADAGIAWHRIDIDWDLIERIEGQKDWAVLDATVAAARNRGLSLLGSIAYTPAWASGADPRAHEDVRRGQMPRDPTRFVQFVDEVIDQYGHAFQALAIWNEPNQPKYFHGTRRQYLDEILQPGLERLRDRAPGIVRCGPDISSSTNRKPYEWLRDALSAAGHLIDVVTYHQYDGDDTSEGRAREIEKVKKIVAEQGLEDRELWITETGWKRPEVTADAQADHLAGMMAAMSSRSGWWTKTFWYDSHGVGEGLLGPDGSPDQGVSFPALHRYAKIIQDSRPA